MIGAKYAYEHWTLTVVAYDDGWVTVQCEPGGQSVIPVSDLARMTQIYWPESASKRA